MYFVVSSSQIASKLQLANVVVQRSRLFNLRLAKQVVRCIVVDVMLAVLTPPP